MKALKDALDPQYVYLYAYVEFHFTDMIITYSWLLNPGKVFDE